jgi:hypothetical protein
MMRERGLYILFLLTTRCDACLHRHVSEKITVELAQDIILASGYQQEF